MKRADLIEELMRLRANWTIQDFEDAYGDGEWNEVPDNLKDCQEKMEEYISHTYSDELILQTLGDELGEEIDYTTYKGKLYPTRTIEFSIEGGEPQNYTIASQSLSDAFESGFKNPDDCWDDPDIAAIDEEIYFYLEDKLFALPAKTIVEQHLDEPHEFVGE